jgi:EAL domain-containing protein (putative c-di-GMP-specific phosphodiesterase class I)
VDSISEPFELSTGTATISVSIGIAFAGQGKDVPEQLLRDADFAMYQAKRKRGDQSQQVIDLRERQQQDLRATLEVDLHLAIARSELRAVYQPIVDTSNGRLVGVEALLRWDHPTQGAVPPLTLIPVAEQAGLINTVGRWVLEQACLDRHRWASPPQDGGQARADEFVMAVNVSAQQLMAPGFVAVVADVLAATDTPPRLLTLEITESVFIDDSERALVVLQELKQLGVLLALDDFGTGYSSLLYLKAFPIDIVKIDRAFTAELSHDRASHAIVGKVIELAHMLGMRVVTEGVESVEQLHEISLLGSEFSQGYYFARPMTADDLDLINGPGTMLCLPSQAV